MPKRNPSKFERRARAAGLWERYEKEVDHLAAIGEKASRAREVTQQRFEDELLEAEKAAAAAAPDVDLEDVKNMNPADARSVVNWVAQRIGLAKEKVDWDTAPDNYARGMLQLVQENGQAKMKFFEKIWPAVFAGRDELASADRFKDDGRPLIELCEQLAEMAVAAGKEADEREKVA